MELDYGSRPHKLCVEYLDIYEGIQSEIVNTTRFDENSDLSTTYLGKSLRKAKVPKSNLTNQEKIGLSQLTKDKDRLILTADKGVAMVIMDKEDYNNKV